MQASSSHAPASPTTDAWDWAALALLAALEALLNVIEPFHRFVGAGTMTDLRYPSKSNTVPRLIFAVVGPVIIFTLIYIRKRNAYDLHHAILVELIVSHKQDAVGRPRPNFFWRCFPDGKAVFDKITTEVICHGVPSVIKEGFKSFPSGHTSWSFAGLVFLSWYLAGKITVFDRRGHVAKLCVVLMPLLLAVMVAISRVDDYWQDVCTGGVHGFISERELESQTLRDALASSSTGAAAAISRLGQTSQALEAGTGSLRDSTV